MIDNKPELSELRDQAHVWYCSFSELESELPVFEELLSEDEKKRAANFKFKKDRNTYLISRGLLRVLLGAYLSMRPSLIKFGYTAYGKPYLPYHSLNFNVSHSGDMAVFAFILESEIGVDIEKIKNDFDVLEIAQNFFSQREIATLTKMPKDLQYLAFYRCWTRKEAFIKAEGSGLSFPLDSFAVSMTSDETATLLETTWNAEEKKKWGLYTFIPEKNYRAALAIRDKKEAPTIRRWRHG